MLSFVWGLWLLLLVGCALIGLLVSVRGSISRETSCLLTFNFIAVTSNSRDVIRSAFMLFVWAQFELQVGIMCASAPALRVFFRRYLGGSQASSNSDDSHGTTGRKSITFAGGTAHAPVAAGPAFPSREKQEFHELRDLGTPVSEDGGDGLSMEGRVRERDLTRYEHEEDLVGVSGLK